MLSLLIVLAYVALFGLIGYALWDVASSYKPQECDLTE
jgi:hypothetical protein